MAKTSAGRIGKEAERFIMDNYQTMTLEQMAEQIQKTPESVRKKLAQLGIDYATKDAKKVGAYADIRQGPYWKQLKSELTSDELELFIEHWKEIISQFQDDIFHTEKLQVMDLIKTEILMSRDLMAEKRQTDIVEMATNRMQEINDDPDLSLNEKEELLHAVTTELGMAISVGKDIRKSYNDLAKEKKNLVRALKASREQRVQRLNDSKQNFIVWLGEIMADSQKRRKIGIEMEKMRLAMEVEMERLGEYHVYEDGEVDRPFLTPETVMRDADD